MIELIIFKILNAIVTYITVCNITNVIKPSVIWFPPSLYFYRLTSNKLALLFSEHQSQWPLLLKNATLCAEDPRVFYFLCLRHLPSLLSSTPAPQQVSTIRSQF